LRGGRVLTSSLLENEEGPAADAHWVGEEELQRLEVLITKDIELEEEHADEDDTFE